jgi:hypothetical protein
MATSYEIFIDPGVTPFPAIAEEFAACTGAQLVATRSGTGRAAYDVYLPDRNRFLVQSDLPGARERLMYDGARRADFMACDEPGNHYYFEDASHPMYAYRSYRAQITLDVFFEEDTPEMREYAWRMFEQCASRWPSIITYNDLDVLWAVGAPGQQPFVITDLANDFVGPHIIGQSIADVKSAGSQPNVERWL